MASWVTIRVTERRSSCIENRSSAHPVYEYARSPVLPVPDGLVGELNSANPALTAFELKIPGSCPPTKDETRFELFPVPVSINDNDVEKLDLILFHHDDQGTEISLVSSDLDDVMISLERHHALPEKHSVR